MNKSQAILLPVLFIILQGVAISCTNKERANNGGSTEDSSTMIPENTSVINTSIGNANGNVNFVAASKVVMPAVVHIKIHFNASSDYGASGSGVIISPDGFIATNNHVVENATAIDVILPDKRTFSAKLIGRDPNTDLALIKVDANNLPVVKLGNSDKVQIGEWVLAVAFPFHLIQP